jgi:hypothetical protein
MAERPRLAAIEGWYSLDETAPTLIGSRCTSCGTLFYPPPQGAFCRNPDCEGEIFDRVPLSRTGRIWSFTNACYQPPAPFVAANPFVPFAIAAVELEREKMIVLGQVVSGVGVEDLEVGLAVELVLETLHVDAAGDKLIWKWKPVRGAP